MNTPTPATVRKQQEQRAIALAKSRGIRVTEKKEKKA